MDLLRLYLPGLHQALRGALESLSTFVSYLMGDEVPTVERGARTAEGLGEGVEEEAQEALEGLEGDLGEATRGPDGHEEASTCQEGNSAEAETRGWDEGGSQGSQTDKQTMGAWEAVQVARCQELSAPSGDVPSGTGQGAHWDSSSQAQQRQEPGEQEVDREDTLRTWDQEEGEGKKIRTGEAGMARGVEPEWTWHGTPEGQVGASGSGQEGTGGGGQTGQEVKEAVAEETEEPVANKAGREEKGVVVGRGSGDTGSQGSGAEPGHWEALGREPGGTVSGWEEACTTSAKEVKEERKEEAWPAPSREQAEQPRDREPENGSVLGEGTPEVPGSSWVLEEEEEESREEQEEKVRKEEAWPAPSREQAEQPRDREPENGSVLGEGAPEAPGSSWVLEEEEEWEKRAAALSLFPKLTQALEAESLMAGAQAAKEEAAGQGSAYHAGQPENESALERQDVEMSAGGVGVQEAAETEEAQREGNAAPEPRPWEVLVRERSEEAHCVSPAVLGEEDQDPTLTGGAQTPASPLEEEKEELGAQEEPRRTTAPSTEGTEGDLDECSRPEVQEADAWENQRRDPWEAEGGDADGQESAASAQTLEWEANSSEGREWKTLEVPGADGDWERAKTAGCGAGQGEAHRVEDQEVAGSPEAEAGMGWSLGEAREALEGEHARLQEEAEGASRPGCRPQEEVAQSLQEGLEAWRTKDEAGGPGRGTGVAWQGKGEAVEAEAPGRLDWGLQGSAEEEVTSQEEHTEALGARTDEQAEAGTLAEATVGLGSHGLGSQAARAEGTRETLGDEWRLLEPEAGERQDKEGLCRVNHPDSEAPGVQATGEQRAEAQHTDTSSVVAIQAQAGQPPAPAPAEPSGAQSSWSEALLPVEHLDVSVPRSRALLARSSSQRRSRPSFRRPRDTQEQEGRSSPQQPKEEEQEEEEQGMSALAEERGLQSEEPPEPSPPGPVGTPVPARRTPGQGFGLAHPGMMQELQARLGRPKPQ
ncbi:apolipoprotein B receptor [Ochotona princeps]|uniref:apolipoprotein B receptor n=1 Tax=Ochotona princeps TaxID=9978 RepID=UPI0027151513|nr:apolipoprotein B receptor [Ochotona princeps]